VCHRTVSGAPGPYKCQPATLRNSRARSAIIHRIVRCASGATAICANGRLCTDEQYTTVPRRSQSSEVRGAPDCPVPQEDKAPTIDPTPNPNGWVAWWRTGQGTVPVRWRTGLSDAPITSSLPNDYEVVEGYKYPCWGLVLKYYELITRQHKMLNINALRPLKHYLPKDLINFGRRP
jgi:hypothetical protein